MISTNGERKKEDLYRRKRTPVIAFWILILLAVITAGWTVTGAYWLLYPYDPLTIESPIKILNEGKKVRQGGILSYRVKWDKKMDITGILTRKLINSYTINLNETRAINKVGPGEANVHIEIPSTASPGMYILTWSVTYKVNPIRTVTIPAVSEEFEVLAYNAEIDRLKKMLEKK